MKKEKAINLRMTEKEISFYFKSKLQLQVSHPDKSSSYRILGIHSVCSP